MTEDPKYSILSIKNISLITAFLMDLRQISISDNQQMSAFEWYGKNDYYDAVEKQQK